MSRKGKKTKYDFIVDSNGNGTHLTLQEAMKAATPLRDREVTILVRKKTDGN